MATTNLFVLLASVLLHAALTLPISQERKSELSSEIMQYVAPTEMSVVIHPDTILNPGEDTKQVKTMDRVPFDHVLKRTKRGVIEGYHNCAEGMVWFEELKRCVTFKMYAQLKEDDYV